MIENILIVGCGNIGFRHLQSVLQIFSLKKITLVDKNDYNFLKFKSEIEEKRPDIKFNFERNIINVDKNIKFNFVISATTAEAQLNVIREVLKINFDYFLLEKPICQSFSDLNLIKDLFEKENVISKVFINCSQNAWLGHIHAKDILNKNKNENKNENENEIYFLDIRSPDLGMGCNAVHYIELFRFLFDSKEISCYFSSLNVVSLPHKRGTQFEEYDGIICLNDENGNILKINSLTLPDNSFHEAKIEALNLQSKKVDLIIDQEQNELILPISNSKICLGKSYVSNSTNMFMENVIINKNIYYPNFNESFISHTAFFRAFQKCMKRDRFNFT